MAAPRSTSLRPLRALAQQYPSSPSLTNLPPRRCLHITGAFSAQVAPSLDKPPLYTSRTLADLKQECERRSLRTGGTKSELIDRLTNFDMLHSRASSIALRKIDGNPFGSPRQFNTSRASKAVKDTSTVDFVYMPSPSEFEMSSAFSSQPRVPVISDMRHSSDSGAQPLLPMKPQIYTVSEMASDISASPMSEVVDNHALEIDPFKLTETVGKSRHGESQRIAAASMQQQNGMIGQLWTGFLDDLLGPKEGIPIRK
ncbi:hypothetical protein V8E54_001686 [Elaphomyces granulatus]